MPGFKYSMLTATTATNIRFPPKTVRIYESLWSKEASDRLIEQISILTFSTNSTQRNIDFKDMHRQSGGIDCGLLPLHLLRAYVKARIPLSMHGIRMICENTLVTVLKQVLSNYLSLRKDVTENQRQYKQYCFIAFAELVALLKRT